jgi:hypothetical protein
MKKSHESRVAIHIGRESCGAAREGGVEALTGDRAGLITRWLPQPTVCHPYPLRHMGVIT